MQDKSYYLFANPNRPASIAAAKELACLLSNSNAEIIVDEWLHKSIGLGKMCSLIDIDESVNAIISLGGDGTLLRTIPVAAAKNIPVLGINLGHIGFLLEVDTPRLENVVQALVRQEYSIEKRMLLKCSTGVTADILVMNDVVLSRGLHPSIVSVQAYAADELIFVCKGDGVLVSTPTGTTGYALSAGGPVISPKVPCILIMPICSRVMHQRPVVLPQDEVIRLCTDISDNRTLELTTDGQNIISIEKGKEVVIRRAAETAQFIRFAPQRFLERLRQKQAEWSKE